ncbi:hypothetical protein AMC99_00174 [Altererythrobacter epoxidivorans]|uniref:Lipid A core-O-antigen ligase n=1 Tax=Altererythrobacter epoxidivorans TaxID=361183 RepID=A0A0M4M2C6_9SPHN|nr:O-antigen ligase family protein [Altererythrobacter epoxidivorans]ALE15490.1 hypothetical protein AMC99_00174 [Altererythrobacter epoxidivorans]
MTGAISEASPPAEAQPGEAGRLRDDVARLLPLAILTYSYLLFPPETRFAAETLALPLYRIAIIVFAYPAAARFIRGEVRMQLPDFLVLAAAGWMIVSFLAVYSVGEGLIRSGAIVIDTAGAYFVARSSVQNLTDLRRLLVILAPGLAFAGATMFLESISREVFYRPMFAGLLGPLPLFAAGEVVGTMDTAAQLRLGLARGLGPFSHQILGGSILASVFALYALSRLRSWPRWAGLLAAVCGFFSLSSAAILGLLFAAGMIVTDRVRAMVRGANWYLILAAYALGALALQVFSESGLINLISRLTLNPQTAFYRQLIWQYGWQAVLEHPLVGLGYGQHDRPQWLGPSVDAHFLALAIRHGVLVPILLMTAVIVIMVVLGRSVARSRGMDRDLLFGVNVTIAMLFTLSMTVMFFSEANIWFMSMIAVGASLAYAPITPAVSKD